MFWQKKSSMLCGPPAILLLLVLGLSYDLFQTVFFYDILMHFLGGVVFVVTFAGLLWQVWPAPRGCRPSLAAMRVLLLCGVLLISFIWEWAEVVLGMTPNWTDSVQDTLGDVLCALAGAIVVLYFIRAD